MRRGFASRWIVAFSAQSIGRFGGGLGMACLAKRNGAADSKSPGLGRASGSS